VNINHQPQHTLTLSTVDGATNELSDDDGNGPDNAVVRLAQQNGVSINADDVTALPGDNVDADDDVTASENIAGVGDNVKSLAQPQAGTSGAFVILGSIVYY
jgi:hypothetical protein